MKPRNLKQALENGYQISRINYINTSKCRVDVKPQFYRPGMKAIVSFWMNSGYMKRVYPHSCNHF